MSRIGFWPEDELILRSEAKREEKRKLAEGTFLGKLGKELKRPGIPKKSDGKVVKEKKLAKVKEEGIPCTKCKIAGKPCPPEGITGKLMFIGIAPGEEEDKKGRVFYPHI